MKETLEDLILFVKCVLFLGHRKHSEGKESMSNRPFLLWCHVTASTRFHFVFHFLSPST